MFMISRNFSILVSGLQSNVSFLVFIFLKKSVPTVSRDFREPGNSLVFGLARSRLKKHDFISIYCQ